MDRDARRNLANSALRAALSADGWEWLLPPARDCLRRMVTEYDAPAEVPERLAHELSGYMTSEPAFAAEPLGPSLTQAHRLSKSAVTVRSATCPTEMT